MQNHDADGDAEEVLQVADRSLEDNCDDKQPCGARSPAVTGAEEDDERRHAERHHEPGRQAVEPCHELDVEARPR